MKHTEVYGLRTKGTKEDVKGALAEMEDRGEDGHALGPTPLETPSPIDDVCVCVCVCDETAAFVAVNNAETCYKCFVYIKGVVLRLLRVVIKMLLWRDTAVIGAKWSLLCCFVCKK